MYYQLYIQHYRKLLTAKEFNPTALEFVTFYKKMGVLIIGECVQKSDPKKYNTIFAFRDYEHYVNFVKEMKTNEIYQESTKLLDSYREKVETIDFELAPWVGIDIDEKLIQDYISEVKEKFKDSINSLS